MDAAATGPASLTRGDGVCARSTSLRRGSAERFQLETPAGLTESMSLAGSCSRTRFERLCSRPRRRSRRLNTQIAEIDACRQIESRGQAIDDDLRNCLCARFGDCAASGAACLLRPTQARLTTERTDILDMMGEVKLFGANAACDETLAATLKRKQVRQGHERLRVERRESREAAFDPWRAALLQRRSRVNFRRRLEAPTSGRGGDGQWPGCTAK